MRAPYSNIFERTPLRLQGAARIAVWLVINVEEWEITAPMPRTVLPAPQGQSPVPDIANYAWFDYGHRVGFWRMKRALDARGVRATVSLNARVCDDHPATVEAIAEASWEVMAHGYEQRVVHLEPDERATIVRSLDRIEQATGRRPRGWLGPGLAETFDTPDLLAEAGVEYVGDWCNDDLPYQLDVSAGELVAIPYSFELHDIAIFIQGHGSGELFERTRDQLDVLRQDAEESARVMAIATHPYLTGVPHRAKHFELMLDYLLAQQDVVFMTGSEILDWYLAESARVKGNKE